MSSSFGLIFHHTDRWWIEYPGDCGSLILHVKTYEDIELFYQKLDTIGKSYVRHDQNSLQKRL